jgi:hypothetical protein
MPKNLLIRVYLDVKQYNDIIETANNRGIKAKTDSEMIRKVLFEYCDKIDAIAWKLMHEGDKVREMQEILGKKEAIIEKLQGDLREIAQKDEIRKINRNARRKKHEKK